MNDRMQEEKKTVSQQKAFSSSTPDRQPNHDHALAQSPAPQEYQLLSVTGQVNSNPNPTHHLVAIVLSLPQTAGKSRCPPLATDYIIANQDLSESAGEDDIDDMDLLGDDANLLLMFEYGWNPPTAVVRRNPTVEDLRIIRE